MTATLTEQRHATRRSASTSPRCTPYLTRYELVDLDRRATSPSGCRARTSSSSRAAASTTTS